MTKGVLRNSSKINVSIVLLSILICVIYTVVYFNAQNYFMMLASIAVIFLPILIFISDKITKWEISDTVKGAGLVFLFASGVLGGVANFYGTIPLYDKIVHFASGLLFSWIIAEGLLKLNKKYELRLFVLSLICFNASIAAFWEICEFTFDTVFNKQVQRGQTDTMMDMIVAVIGGVIVALVYIIKHKKNLR